MSTETIYRLTSADYNEVARGTLAEHVANHGVSKGREGRRYFVRIGFKGADYPIAITRAEWLKFDLETEV